MACRQLPEMPAAPVLEYHGQRKVFHIPQGLKLLLEELTREVLRSQPTNLYQFIAGMLEDKLTVRDFKEKVMKMEAMGNEGSRKSWQWRRWSWDGSSILSEQEIIEFLKEFKLSFAMAQRLALIIQSAYRGFIARKKAKGLKEEHDQRRSSLWDEWRHPGNLFVSGRDVLDILAYYQISLFEANAFATKIQKVFRGHFQRKHLEETDPELAAHLHSLGITKKMADTHAARIQSAFRGYMARKSRKDQDVTTPTQSFNSFARQYQEEMGGEDDFEMGPDGEEEEWEGIESERARYEAFFPDGLDAAEEEEIYEGAKLPPRFTHEHFGEIDPKELREKFSRLSFKQKMSTMLLGLEEATVEQRKANTEEAESKREIHRQNMKSNEGTKAVGSMKSSYKDTAAPQRGNSEEAMAVTGSGELSGQDAPRTTTEEERNTTDDQMRGTTSTTGEEGVTSPDNPEEEQNEQEPDT